MFHGKNYMQVIALIPSYNPSEQLVSLVQKLAAGVFDAVIVVNDGSAPEFDHCFSDSEKIQNVTVLHHAVNLGKGAALKAGLNYIYCHYKECIGVVAVDADGQHLAVDATKVAMTLRKNPESLIIGARAFDGAVPMRSRFGNSFTRTIFRVLTGKKISDTQSGLRGIPQAMIPSLLKTSANGYEFELDMLLACKYTGRQIIEESISTVYLEGNKSSHFNPLIDSMKIYFVLFRFTLAALLSAVIDYTVFIFVYHLSSSISASQASARLVSMGFNYTAIKKAVFYSNQKTTSTFPKYLILVCISGFVSFLLIKGFVMFLNFPVVVAKVVAESIVFLANFAIQRDFIFINRHTECPLKATVH